MNLNKLKNGKFYSGKFDAPNEYGGWFIGDFLEEGDSRKTKKLEVTYKEQKAGDILKPHYHENKVELTIMIEGEAIFKVNDEEVILKAGHYLFVDVNNVVSSKYLKHSKIFGIHSPSLPRDKVVVEE